MADRPVDLEALLAHRAFVKALARRLVRDDARAEDVVQDTYVTAMENPPRHGGALRAWLATVVRKMAWTHNRSEARRTAREHKRRMPEPIPKPDDVVERAQWHQRLVNLVMQLEEPFRSTVLLSYFEGLSSQEIAKLQGIKAGTVRTRLHRALAQLRETLDKETEGGRSTWLPALTLLGWPPAWTASPDPAPETAAVGSGAPRWPWLAMAAGVVGIGVLVTAVVGDRTPSPERTERTENASKTVPTKTTPENETDVTQTDVSGQEVRVLRAGRPVADAVVVVLRLQPHLWRFSKSDRWTEWSTARTDADGVARVRSVPSGYARFLAAAPGAGRGHAVSYFPHTYEESVVISLPAEQPARVVVLDDAGAAVVGAVVELLDEGERVRIPATPTLTTDAEGAVVLRGVAADARVLVRASAPGYEPSRAHELEQAGDSDQPLEIRLRRVAPPIEWLLATGSAPADGTTIVLRRRNEEFPIGTARIERGRLAADDLDAWMPSLLAVAPDGRVADLDDAAPVGAWAQDEMVEFREPEYFDVAVRDANGPCAGVEVRLFDAATGSPCFPDARSDGEGRARLKLHGKDAVRVGWRDVGQRDFRIAGVWSPGKTRRVELTIPSRRRVVFVFADALPIRFAMYRGDEALVSDGYALSPDRRELAATWRPRAGSGAVTWSVLARNHAPWRGVVEPADERVAVDLVATGGLVLSISRRDHQSYSLELVPEGSAFSRGPYAFRLYAGPDDVVRETMLPPGRYRVRDRSRDVTTDPFEIRAGRSTDAWLDLRAADTPPMVSGRVVGFRDVDLTQAQVLIRASDGGWRAAARVAPDGSFSLPWRDADGELLLFPTHPEAEDSDVLSVDGPRGYFELRLRPSAQAKFAVEPRPDDGPVRIFAGRHELPGSVRDGVLHVGGFRFPAPKTWIDVPGFAPYTLPAGALSSGGRLDLSRGTVLRITVRTRDGVLSPELRIRATRTNASTDRAYHRKARTKGADETRVFGLGAGTFAVTVWDENTGQVVWTKKIEVNGSGERRFVIDLR